MSDLQTVTDLEAAIIEIKADFAAGLITDEQYDNAKRTLVEARAAWRHQEEQAGNRSGFVGGNATSED